MLIKEVLKLRNKGLPINKIAKTLKISKPRVIYLLKVAEVENLKEKYKRKLTNLEERKRRLKEKEEQVKKQIYESYKNRIINLQNQIRSLQFQIQRLETKRKELMKSIQRLKGKREGLLATIEIYDRQIIKLRFLLEKAKNDLIHARIRYYSRRL